MKDCGTELVINHIESIIHMILIILLKYYLTIINILVLKVSNEKDWTEECYSIVTLNDDHIIFSVKLCFL